MQEGNAALARRDYAAAEAAAREVLANRTSPRAYDAQFLLAQALSGEQQYPQAAMAYDDAYNRSRTGTHAQDARLGLAVSLTAINEKKAACDVLSRMRTEFPHLRPDISAGMAATAQKAGLPLSGMTGRCTPDCRRSPRRWTGWVRSSPPRPWRSRCPAAPTAWRWRFWRGTGRGSAVGRSLALVVDHGLRAESARRGADHGRAAGRPGHSGAVAAADDLPHGPALAERARIMRYQALSDACPEAGVLHLLLGHHAADQAETLAMRVLRGSQTHGLAGMAALRETATLRLLRPLLGIAAG